jgi:hypothetical protein
MDYSTSSVTVNPISVSNLPVNSGIANNSIDFKFDRQKARQAGKPDRVPLAVRQEAENFIKSYSQPGPARPYNSTIEPELARPGSENFTWFNKRNERNVGLTLFDKEGAIEPGRAVHAETGELVSWCTRYAGFAYSPGTGTVHRLNCKSRQCEHCSLWWSLNWQKSIQAKVEADQAIGLKPPSRTIVLTSAYDAGHKKFWAALRYFWQLIRARKELADIQYWGVVEYNQDHTQPHFHFILANDAYIPYAFLQKCWKTAQKWAHFKKIAWNVWIEKIKPGNLFKYLLKYLGGAKGGKDEVPRPENWSGRYTRSSRKFFQHGRQAMLNAVRLQNWLIKIAVFQMDGGDPDSQSGPAGRAFSLYSLRPAELSYFLNDADLEFSKLQYLITRKWDYEQDRLRATKVNKEG